MKSFVSFLMALAALSSVIVGLVVWADYRCLKWQIDGLETTFLVYAVVQTPRRVCVEWR